MELNVEDYFNAATLRLVNDFIKYMRISSI